MTFTMNRSEARNALSPQMLVKMAEVWYEFRNTQSLQIENEVSAAVMASKDAREGPRAFEKKRKPRFIGE